MNRAEEYARHGKALIKIPPRKKGPTTKGWNEKANAITDPERAGELTGNIGLVDNT